MDIFGVIYNWASEHLDIVGRTVVVLIMFFLFYVHVLAKAAVQTQLDDLKNSANTERRAAHIDELINDLRDQTPIPIYIRWMTTGLEWLDRLFSPAWSWKAMGVCLHIAIAYQGAFLFAGVGLDNSIADGDELLTILGVPMIAGAFAEMLVARFPVLAFWLKERPKPARTVSSLLRAGTKGGLAAGLAFAFAVAVAGAVTVSGTVAIAGDVAVAGAFTGAVAIAGAFAGAFAVAGAFAGAFAVAGAFAGAVAGAFAVAFAFAGVWLGLKFPKAVRYRLIPVFFLILALLLVASRLETRGAESLILVALLLPFINMLYDFLSWWISRGLGHHLLRTIKLSWDTGRWQNRIGRQGIFRVAVRDFLFDLFAAVLLLAALLWTVTVVFEVIYSGNGVFIRELVDDNSSELYWLFLMAISTIVPTIIHLATVVYAFLANIPVHLGKFHEAMDHLEKIRDHGESLHDPTLRQALTWRYHSAHMIWVMWLIIPGLFVAFFVGIFHWEESLRAVAKIVVGWGIAAGEDGLVAGAVQVVLYAGPPVAIIWICVDWYRTWQATGQSVTGPHTLPPPDIQASADNDGNTEPAESVGQLAEDEPSNKNDP